jgi:hypothetical protein
MLPSLNEEFEQLLMESQQGAETYQMAIGKEVDDSILTLLEKQPFAFKTGAKKPKLEGQRFKDKLKRIPCGRASWKAYENLMEDVLKFLFKTDLTMWDPQQRTDDTLSRFDLVCRINGFDSFWKAMIRSFNTRFVLFEFKNYCDELTQHQVYTTERYLYKNALRSVGFIVSRKGASEGAEQAAKGALRENGKLIIFLDDRDINKMLDIKDNDGIPNDYLADCLDKWLVGLSR